LGEEGQACYRGWERRNGGGECICQLLVELKASEMVPERPWLSLFIGRPWWFAIAVFFLPREIFSLRPHVCSKPRSVHLSASLSMLLSGTGEARSWGSGRAGKVKPHGHGAVPIGEIFGRREGVTRPHGLAVFAIIFTCS
jgi:hypothetical protein